jgi:ligand-binding sensor domain-containing protein
MRKIVAIFIVGMAIPLFFPQPSAAQWVQTQTAGPEGWNITALVVSGTHLFAGTSKGVFLSADGGASWKAVNSGLPQESRIECLAASGPNVFAGINGAGVFLSADNGGSWKAVGQDRPELGSIYSLAVSRKYLVAGAFKGVFLSPDGGATWKAAKSGLPDYTWISSLYESGPNLFAGTKAHTNQGVGQSWPEINSVFLSADGGASWKNTQARFSSAVNCLAVIGTNLFVGTDRGLYLCSDFGNCPKAAKLSLSKDVSATFSVTSFVVIGMNLFVGTDKGVYLIKNRGLDWTTVNSGFPENVPVTCLAKLGDYLLAGTQGGVWRLPLSDLAIEKK